MSARPITAIGILGAVLDSDPRPNRWDRWRPTVSLCQHEELLIHQFHLIHEKKIVTLAKTVAEDIRHVSPETTVIPHELNFRDPWDFQEVYATLHDFTRAHPINPDKEDCLVHITTGTHVQQICLFLLTESRHFPGRLIQTRPSRKRNTSGEFTIIDLDLSKYDNLAMRFEMEERDEISFLKSGIETRNAAFNDLIGNIERVATGSTDPILLMGPTGAGKSQLARRIYELKKQRRQFTGEFIEVNCATIRGDGAMSALFGHKRGAFTGAQTDRAGLLRAADGGMLFLDEVGELAPDEQAMLLRAVEEKRFFPLGSDRVVESDFQLICGTNHDLRADVRAGSFRDDLFARINLWTFHLPGLRERPEDIEPNLDYELERHTRRTSKLVTFNREARERFLRFAASPEAHWSSNFRDLGGAITRMVTLSRAGRITLDGVEEEIIRLQSAWSSPATSDCAGNDLLRRLLGTAADDLDQFDRIQLAGVLEVCVASRSISEAGRALFAKSRSKKATPNDADRLRKYLLRFGLDWDSLRAIS